MSDHGHVFPRPDGVKARCGGPALCAECKQDLVAKNAQEQVPSKEQVCEHDFVCLECGASLDQLQQPLGWMTEGGEAFIEHRLKLERPEDFVRFTIPVPRAPTAANEEPAERVPSKEHVCRYLELQPDGTYFCGGCQKTYRLAHEPPVDEPVAWIIPGDDNAYASGALDAYIHQHGEFTRPLYAHPAPPPSALRDALDAIASPSRPEDYGWWTQVARRALGIATARETAQPPLLARPLNEWHEDMGDVVWWKFPVDEPAWIGSPLASDWPGYHTHWTPHPAVPEAIRYSTATKGDSHEG